MTYNYFLEFFLFISIWLLFTSTFEKNNFSIWLTILNCFYHLHVLEAEQVKCNINKSTLKKLLWICDKLISVLLNPKLAHKWNTWAGWNMEFLDIERSEDLEFLMFHDNQKVSQLQLRLNFLYNGFACLNTHLIFDIAFLFHIRYLKWAWIRHSNYQQFHKMT